MASARPPAIPLGMLQDQPPPIARPDLVSLPLSGRSVKMSNKIQQRAFSADADRSPRSARDSRGRPQEPPRDARDLQLLRELSRDIKDQLCQSVRAAVREELQSVLQPHGGAPWVPGSAADSGDHRLQARVDRQLHQTADIKEIARKNNLATSSRDAVGKVDSIWSTTSPGHCASPLVEASWSPRRAADVVREMTTIKMVSEPLAKVFPPGHTCFAPLYRLADWFDILEEPERTGFMARFAASSVFEAFSILGIVLNCAFMVASADYAAREYWRTDTTSAFKAIEALFLVWFGIELGVRMYVHGRYFYISPNWMIRILDTVLIIFQIWSVLGNYDVISSQHNLSFFRRASRAVKMLRVLRVIRAIKAMHHFKQLHAMLCAIQTSLMTLLWSMLMVTSIIWMFALLFVQVTTVHFQNLSEQMGMSELDIDELSVDQTNLMAHFGSVSRAMISLLMATTGGEDWSLYYSALSPAGLPTKLTFLAFIALMQFAVLNIVTGIFVESAMKEMEQDPKDAAMEVLRKRQQQEQDLIAVCREADTNKNGTLCRQEFFGAIRAGKLTGFLDSLGFRNHDLIDFFRFLESTSPDQKVNLDVFVTGCMELSGGATRFGVKALLMEIQAVQDAVADLRLGLLRAQGVPAMPQSSALDPV